jgi:hypothetical protein
MYAKYTLSLTWESACGKFGDLPGKRIYLYSKAGIEINCIFNTLSIYTIYFFPVTTTNRI